MGSPYSLYIYDRLPSCSRSFDAPVPRSDVEEVTAFKRVDEKGAPLSTVVFKYRSKGMFHSIHSLSTLVLTGFPSQPCCSFRVSSPTVRFPSRPSLDSAHPPLSDGAPLPPSHDHHPDETRHLRSFRPSASAAAVPNDRLPRQSSLLASQHHQHPAFPSPHHHHHDGDVSDADLDLEMQDRLAEIRRLEQELEELNAVKLEVEEEERQPLLKRVKRELEQEPGVEREESRYTVATEVDGKGKKVEVLILEDE